MTPLLCVLVDESLPSLIIEAFLLQFYDALQPCWIIRMLFSYSKGLQKRLIMELVSVF
ncbi:hypothetical protein NC653_035656 [Populus alba x Populus x berolinensis]|uniref:Uncharacterized protein n=1 Tax=Populus alba x Populus x berolinensis TaxID=444605 RepID=A0AAD6LI51_9ROSI|nr:hypothetical protein NC653_035656 [Populus alba x Populus x berolinensis]